MSKMKDKILKSEMMKQNRAPLHAEKILKKRKLKIDDLRRGNH